MITRDSPMSLQTISRDGVASKLRNTPLESTIEKFIDLSKQYQIDSNWAISYLQWESNFGQSSIGRANPTNPWDILCSTGQWGQIGDYAPGNGYCYAVYPSIEAGLEAGFRLWKSYIDRGWNTWFSSLSVAQCGNPGGCNNEWVDRVIGQGKSNEAQWPFTGSEPNTQPITNPRMPPNVPDISVPGITGKQFTMQDIIVIGSLAAIAIVAIISMGNQQTGQIVIQRGGEA